MDVTTEGIVVLGVLAIFWVGIAYEMWKAPLVDDNFNIIEEDINLEEECRDEDI